MKTNSLPIVFALCAGSWLAASCRLEPKTQDTVTVTVPSLGSNAMASVQGRVITEASYRQRLQQRVAGTQAAPSLAQKEAVLEDMIRQEAVYAQAKAARFDERPEIAALIRDFIASRYIDEQLPKGEPAITHEAVREYYERHAAAMVAPAAARGALILLRAATTMTPVKRAELQEQARRILAEARETQSEAGFARLVQRHSEHQPTRYRGGDLGWMTREQCEAALGARFAAALFALAKPDEISLLESPEGFYILRLREWKEAAPRPLAEVEESIRYQLSRQRHAEREAEFYARMKRGLEMHINRPLLESLAVPLPADPPPGPPGSTRSTTAQRVATR